MIRSTIIPSLLAVSLLACGDRRSAPEQQAGSGAAALETSAECHVGTPGDDGYCTVDCPCDIGEADCNSSTECAAGLKCLFNHGADFGYEPDTDVCACPLDSDNGSGSFCSELCPCEVGQGDCDTSADCEPGLSCFRDIGGSFGLDEEDDVCAVCPPADADGTLDFCTPGCPCSEGKGDCDTDADCATGMQCFNNVGTEFGYDDPDMDVCATCPPDSMLGHVDYCSPGCTCSEGDGDCDVDADCDAGLQCFLNVGPDFGYDDPDMDVCATCPPDSLNGKIGFCSTGCLCSAGQGDCNSSDECAAGLTCFFDVGADYGMRAEVDICDVCPPASKNGSFGFCSPGCPCSAGQGDCNSSDDCAAGLTCAFNVGANFGFDPDVDVCLDLGG